MFLGKSYFDQRPALCDLIATVCLVTCITSLFNLGFLAFSRLFSFIQYLWKKNMNFNCYHFLSYIQICHNNLYKKLFRKKLTFLYCIISWLIGFAMDIPNYTGLHYKSLLVLLRFFLTKIINDNLRMGRTLLRWEDIKLPMEPVGKSIVLDFLPNVEHNRS